MESTGQRIGSVVVDIAYFVTLILLAKWKVLEGQAIVGLLGVYGGGRVGVGMRKQEAKAAALSSGVSSDRMRAVEPPDDDPQGGAPVKQPPRYGYGRPVIPRE